MPSPLLITFADTPDMALREFATVVSELDPCDIEIVDEDFAVLIPNVLATCPTVTVPEPTVPPGVMLVTDLKTHTQICNQQVILPTTKHT